VPSRCGLCGGALSTPVCWDSGVLRCLASCDSSTWELGDPTCHRRQGSMLGNEVDALVAARLFTGFFAGRHIVLAFALVALPSCFRREGLTNVRCIVRKGVRTCKSRLLLLCGSSDGKRTPVRFFPSRHTRQQILTRRYIRLIAQTTQDSLNISNLIDAMQY